MELEITAPERLKLYRLLVQLDTTTTSTHMRTSVRFAQQVTSAQELTLVELQPEPRTQLLAVQDSTQLKVNLLAQSVKLDTSALTKQSLKCKRTYSNATLEPSAP